jgi:hypothetical protein
MQERGPYYTIDDGVTAIRTVRYSEDQDGGINLETIRQRAVRHVLGDRKLNDKELIWVHEISTSSVDASFPLITHELTKDQEGRLLLEVFGTDRGMQALIKPNPDVADAFDLDLNSPVNKAT